MTVHFESELVTVLHGDCLDELRSLPDASVHAVVTDPPYGIAFMGKAWDQPGEFGSTSQAGGGLNKNRGAKDAALEAGKYDLSPTAMRNFQRWVEAWAAECLRVLKPGGHLLAFGGSRTWHRLAGGIEDAGFEIRDSIAWLYGSGFPKSLDVSKAIDKMRDDRTELLELGAHIRAAMDASGVSASYLGELLGINPRGVDLWAPRPTDRSARERVHAPTVNQWSVLRQAMPELSRLDDIVWGLNGRKGEWGNERADRVVSAPGANAVFQPSQTVESAGTPVTPEAQQWAGWGTALKPSFEPIVVARKPFAATVAANVLAHGTGALNITANRVPTLDRLTGSGQPPLAHGTLNPRPFHAEHEAKPTEGNDLGRWPSNVLLDGDQADALDIESGTLKSGTMRAGAERQPRTGGAIGADGRVFNPADTYGDEGGASRFFPVFRWQAKAPTSERPVVDGIAHPTVKPLALMQWLVRLVTPAGGTVLEPFAGSGTTIEAAIREGFNVIGIEREADYLPLIMSRVRKDHAQSLFGDLFDEDGAA